MARCFNRDTSRSEIWQEEQEQHIAAALREEHRAIIEGLYFDFDKATIRPESGVVLSSVAEVLRENPSWKLRVEGNTDRRVELVRTDQAK